MHKWFYLASCDMHNKVHRREIARDRESILNERNDHANRARFPTAMYLVVPVKVPAHELMSSPETPESQSA